jgi:hypothetical protein
VEAAGHMKGAAVDVTLGDPVHGRCLLMLLLPELDLQYRRYRPAYAGSTVTCGTGQHTQALKQLCSFKRKAVGIVGRGQATLVQSPVQHSGLDITTP